MLYAQPVPSRCLQEQPLRMARHQGNVELGQVSSQSLSPGTIGE